MCDYEATYYDYEKGDWVLYKCPHEPSKPYCMFHDGSSYKSRPDDVRNEFYKMVEDAIQNNQPLYCIGFNLPDITVEGKKFTKPVYFSYARFQQADFSYARFQQADFSKAIFQKADFLGARFQYAYFSNAIFQQADFSNAIFQQADFSKAIFQKADFSNAIFQYAYFSYATFQEADFSYATFQEADFSGARFQQQAIFSGARFQQQAIFSGARFQQQAIFSYARFQQQANFSYARFQQQVYFSYATFQEADFSGARFQQQAIFSGARFQQQANFPYARFQQQANFPYARFQQQVYFLNATFQEAIFLYATFQQQVYFLKATFQQANFSYADFIGEVEFINTTFPNEDRTNKHIPIRFDYSTFRSRVRFIGDSNKPLDLSNVSFKGVNLDNVEFHNVKWREDKVLWFLPFIKRNIIADELFMDELKNYQEVSRIYNQLRKNYEMHLHFTEASHFFIGEMEAIRRSRWSKGIEGKLASIPYLLYKYIASYGENVFLPLVFWTPIIIILFAVWRILVSNCYDPQCMIDRVIDSIAAYFQVPRNTLQQDIIERILAVPILGSAFIALRRRFERRK
jgi:uncharacterized protein YjbI with pentapeptide repeats